MATDVDVQYFSHLNGLVLDNNWGDMIRLLDTCLVNGLPLTDVQSAVITPEGNIQITTMSDHNCMLFQIIELSGYTPNKFNGRYRIIGVPETTVLILRADWDVEVIQSVGNTRLAPLGYEIIFRDEGDVKRVYRAVNPRAEHPYIRVDESITSDTGDYTTTYAKSAMVGLLEHMDHIDDYGNPEVLQLPFDSANPTKNWDINGTGTGVIRGWANWYWAKDNPYSSRVDLAPLSGKRYFTIVGTPDSFYINPLRSFNYMDHRCINGCGLIDNSFNSDTKTWFMSTWLKTKAANNSTEDYNTICNSFLTNTEIPARCLLTSLRPASINNNHIYGKPIVINYTTGRNQVVDASNVAAIGIPLSDTDGFLRGSLKHIYFAAKNISVSKTTPILDGSDMYIADAASGTGGKCVVYFYLGEL